MTPDASHTIRLREYEKQPGVALRRDEARQLRDHFGEHLDVTPAFDGAGYDLKAKGSVGVIVLPNVTIRIDSKVPADNLFVMLARAYGLDVQLRGETTTLDAGDSLLEFVAGVFVNQVDNLVRKGIARGYIDLEEEAPYLRGRLLVAQQVRCGPTAATRFHQRANEFTADLLENRILRATLARLLRHYYSKAGLRPSLRRALSAFSEVTPVAARPSDCDRVVYTRLNRRYEPAIRLARLLLQLLSPEGHAGPTPFPAFLVSMDKVFEKFVTNTLAEALTRRPGWEVKAQQKIFFDRDNLERGRPDMVLYRDGQAMMVIDAKYKEYDDKPNPDDRNQLFAYCWRLNVDRGLLLYPNNADTRQSRRLIGGAAEADTVHLSMWTVSLSGRPHEFLQRWDRVVDELITKATPLPQSASG